VSAETFKKTWQGWVTSSEGYAIRVRGRTGIEWRDSLGKMRIDSEAMSKPWNEVVVYTGSIPDTTGRPRAHVLERLRRAFDYLGWRLTLDDVDSD
jgi:hypothetical protein